MFCSSPIKAEVKNKTTKALTAHGSGIAQVPCGQCLNCRINQARVWTNRILLEQTMHSDTIFVTLTYDDDHLPDPPHVSVAEMQSYLKRLRRYYDKSDRKIRHFGVGEYGDSTFRPHYHVLLFGLSYLDAELVKRAWLRPVKRCDPDIGIHIGECNSQSARYITGYVTKKIDKVRKMHPTSYGKADEFMVCSKHGGGIGFPAMEKIAGQMKDYAYWDKKTLNYLIQGGKKLPLGRYLKEKYTEATEADVTDQMLQFWYGQLRAREKREEVRQDETQQKIIGGKRTL